MLYKFILKEEVEDLTCPLCQHGVEFSGRIGHSCKYDQSESKPHIMNSTETIEFFCSYCNLRFLLPVKKGAC